MGIDGVLYAEWTDSGDVPSKELLDELQPWFCERLGGLDENREVVHRQVTEFAARKRTVVVFAETDRHYWPGSWRVASVPRLVGQLVLMRAAFPTAAIYYGSDSGDLGDGSAELVDDLFIAMLWESYTTPGLVE